MRNSAYYGSSVWRNISLELERRLPKAWSTAISRSPSRGADFVVELRAPDNKRSRVLILDRKRAVPRELPGLVRAAGGGSPVMLVAPFIGARARELLVELGANYADATGNMRIALESPALFIERQGADKDPDREARPLRSLKGAAAGRVARALCDFLPPYGVRTLADAASTPLGTVSRVVSLLDEEAIVTRDEKKRVVAVDWPALLRRWTRDYDVKTSNRLVSFIEPRGLAALTEKLASCRLRYAVTGSLAGPGIAAPRLAMIYVEDAAKAARDLELTETDSGSNVWLLEPYDDVVFERATKTSISRPDSVPELVFAARSQVAADLMTSPGRGPQEGEAMLTKMKENENDWRRRP